MNPSFNYINGFDKREHLVVQVYTRYPYPGVEIRRRGQTNNWNVFLSLDMGLAKLSGNLLYGKTVTNEDPTAAMNEAVTIASKYLFEKAVALDLLT